ncbi:MAG: TatD family hydrolase [Anaerolineales bacterium]|jgi:TatD DNase family protein
MSSTPASLVDTHCHLNLAAFEQDRDEVLNRAYEAGITKILIPGIDLETSRQAISIADEHEGIFAAIGFHPHDAVSWKSSSRSELIELAQNPQVVAIGEIGLDYFRNYSDPEIQREVFKEQLDLAIELELPVVIHNREAIRDILPILNEWVKALPEAQRCRAGVMHAFSADEDSASKAIDLGFYIGIAGPITFRNSEALRTLVSRLPLERIVTETDAPYLTPDPHRGKRNEPGYVKYVAAEIAKTHQVDTNLAQKQTAVNASVLFQWNHEITNSHVL